MLGGTIWDLLSGRQNYLTMIPGLAIGSALVHLLFSRYTENWKVTITEDSILGGWKKGKRIIIPIREIDRDRSLKKSFFGKLFGFDYIFSKTGQKIYVESLSLGKEQVGQLRSILKI